MGRKWYDSEIVKIEEQTPTTRRFWLQLPAQEEPFAFRAGQFITMDLPIGQKRLERWRSYSIANAPDNTNEVELCIVNLDGGSATSYLFDEARVGTPIRFKGPDGVFTLPATVDKDLVFVCTGTGVAPFRSMIWDLYRQGKTDLSIHLIFGTRYADGILYREEFEHLLQEMPNFRYSVALSREQAIDPDEFAFPVVSGYVHQVYQEAYGDVRDDIAFYLCGWSQMIDEATETLTEQMGYDQRQVIFELYG